MAGSSPADAVCCPNAIALKQNFPKLAFLGQTNGLKLKLLNQLLPRHALHRVIKARILTNDAIALDASQAVMNRTRRRHLPLFVAAVAFACGFAAEFAGPYLPVLLRVGNGVPTFQRLDSAWASSRCFALSVRSTRARFSGDFSIDWAAARLNNA